MTIIEALEDDALLGSVIKDRATYTAWWAALKGIFGLPMTDAEAAIFRACTGRQELPTAAFAVVWLIIGRRGAKSLMMAVVAVYQATFKDWRRFLSPGERAVVLIVAADKEQAKVVRRYIGGILALPMFARNVESETSETIDLKGSVAIEVATCSYRTVRGRSVCVALLDEVCFWRSESTVNPDKEVWRAIRASMATFGKDAMAFIASSPYSRKGLMWDGYRRYFGQPDSTNLVWQAPTKVMNPTISDDFLREEYEADPAAAAAEYGAQFRTDIENFVSREVVEAAVAIGRHELPPITGERYVAFVDPSGGSADSMTLGIAHRTKDGVAVLDAVRERKPPFSPESVVTDFVDLLKAYGVSRVTGDRYAGEFAREPFRKLGIAYDLSERTASDIFRDSLASLNSGKVELLDHARLVTQLCALERRTTRVGKDSISHQPGGHDDIAVAACGAMLLAENARRPIVITKEMLARFSRPNPGTQGWHRRHGY